MRIVIDARMYQESGVGRYIRNLIDGLQKLDRKNQYFILVLKKDGEIKLNKNFHPEVVNVGWYGLREQIVLPKVLHNLNPDLVHFPHFNVPLLYKGKFVVTIHDLIHQRFAMRRSTTLNPIVYKVKQFGYRNIFKNAIFKSAKIFVPSKFVKKLLVDGSGVVAEKVVITPEAADNKLFLIQKSISKKYMSDTLKKFKIGKPFIFYVGNAHPHKNIEGLISAFRQIKKNRKLQLVMAGHDHYFWQNIKKKHQDRSIIYTGFLTDWELVALYKNAKTFILPSYEEGFGIPLLEAMTCGCPVVSSNAGSLTEVGGDAAIYFDPQNLAEMTQKLLTVLKDDKLKKQLILKGLKRVKNFSWQKLSQQTLEEYLKCE